VQVFAGIFFEMRPYYPDVFGLAGFKGYFNIAVCTEG
jgi:hypothetical protein